MLLTYYEATWSEGSRHVHECEAVVGLTTIQIQIEMNTFSAFYNRRSEVKVKRTLVVYPNE